MSQLVAAAIVPAGFVIAAMLIGAAAGRLFHYAALTREIVALRAKLRHTQDQLAASITREHRVDDNLRRYELACRRLEDENTELRAELVILRGDGPPEAA